MVIQLGYESVKAIDDGGVKLCFLGHPPDMHIPPLLSLEVPDSNDLANGVDRQNAKNTKRGKALTLTSVTPLKSFAKC